MLTCGHEGITETIIIHADVLSEELKLCPYYYANLFSENKSAYTCFNER